MTKVKTADTLDGLAALVPLTEAETRIARAQVNSGEDPHKVVDRLLDERVGPDARAAREYPPLTELTEGWSGRVGAVPEAPANVANREAEEAEAAAQVDVVTSSVSVEEALRNAFPEPEPEPEPDGQGESVEEPDVESEDIEEEK